MIVLFTHFNGDQDLHKCKDHDELVTIISKKEIESICHIGIEHKNLHVVRLCEVDDQCKIANVVIEYDDTIIIYRNSQELIEYMQDVIEGMTDFKIFKNWK